MYVPETILKCYRLLGLPCEEIFTTDQADSLLWFEKLNQISQFDLKKKNSEMPTIAIKLTASGLLYKSTKFKDDELIFTVPYSNHSSASELAKCLDFLQPGLVERIVRTNSQKPGLSIIDKFHSYLATIKAAEMTDDITSDSMEISSFDSPVFNSQAPDYFYSAVSQFQSPMPIAPTGTEDTALSEDMDEELPLELESPRIPVAAQTSPLLTTTSGELDEVVTEVDSIVFSICSDLDQFGEENNNEYTLYSDAFEKLMSLHKIYQPFTDIPMQN